MYSFPYYKAAKHEILPFLHQYPFAFLCSANAPDNRVEATQTPLLVEIKEGKIFLAGHIMKDTPHYNAFLSSAEVLAVFNGPHHYISSNWYPNIISASTWNYMSIHMRGTLRYCTEEELRTILEKITNRFEIESSERRYHHLPEEYIHRLLPYIAGFHIEVTETDTVFKLSQDKKEEVYLSIIKELEKEGDDYAGTMAEEMKKRINSLFHTKK